MWKQAQHRKAHRGISSSASQLFHDSWRGDFRMFAHWAVKIKCRWCLGDGPNWHSGLTAQNKGLGDDRCSWAAGDPSLRICIHVHVALVEPPGKTLSAVFISSGTVREELPSADTLLNTLLCRGLLELALSTGSVGSCRSLKHWGGALTKQSVQINGCSVSGVNGNKNTKSLAVPPPPCCEFTAEVQLRALSTA